MAVSHSASRSSHGDRVEHIVLVPILHVLLESIKARAATVVKVSGSVLADTQRPFWHTSIPPYFARQTFTTFALSRFGRTRLLGEMQGGTEHGFTPSTSAFCLNVGVGDSDRPNFGPRRRPYSAIHVDSSIKDPLHSILLHALTRCELAGDAFILKHGRWENEVKAQFAEAVKTLTRRLTSVSSLYMPVDELHLFVSNLMEQEPHSLLPKLSTLELHFDRGMSKRTTEMEMEMWWDMVQAVLKSRAGAGKSVQCLLVKGRRRSHEPAWAVTWINRASHCQVLGLVQTFRDSRINSTKFSHISKENLGTCIPFLLGKARTAS